jgi:SAM-dependent methyltransferase
LLRAIYDNILVVSLVACKDFATRPLETGSREGKMSKTFTWAKGDAYEPYIGRWSRLVAKDFLDWLAVPSGGNWLDVGCGTGAVTQSILQYAGPASVTGVDSAEGFVAYARERVQDTRARLGVASAMALPFGDDKFDAVVAGLVLNFIPDKEAALAEMVRVSTKDGVVGAYLWDYAEGMQMTRTFWDAAVEMDPAAIEKDQARLFPICKPEPMARLFGGAGLRNVEVRAIDVPTHFRDFDDLWSPYLGGQGPAPGYVVSLTEERRTALREHLRSKLPVASDGSISLVARAWAVRGRKG